jgi:hypothetical protein
LKGLVEIGVVLLHFFRTLEKVLGGNGEKFLVAHHGNATAPNGKSESPVD